ncbi:MAG: tRNA (adenosine(37)-N6)-dimethylallyltransferase MiaA [Bacteroidia bacterium]|nr:tRNA (adenosine(37)-N6)-dimethylallyltransferase MiaA [Bacteroidia bacterium]MDW8346783.1 tRNA (adenosine(37)-N6)-dimethylallyltransferase MiaA [Bacteroidia bacterium]
MQPCLICIVGPTAVGKTALSIQLAQHFNTEILSFDSRQIYKELTIGTAKPTVLERKGIVHHFIDEISIVQSYSAGDFQKQASARLEQLFQKYKVVIAVGGTGLYLKALLEGLDSFPEPDWTLRCTLQEQYQTEGLVPLLQQLSSLDPVTYQNVDKHNPRRVLRALEVCLQTGKPYSSFLSQNKVKPYFKVIKIGLNMPRAELYKRIDVRVLQMIEQGLVQEVQGLIVQNADFTSNALNTVGYKEIYAYLQGQSDLSMAIHLIQQNTRRYAKRQLTWFNADKEIQWFEPHQWVEILRYIELKMV